MEICCDLQLAVGVGICGFVNCRIIIMTSEGDKVGIDLKAFVEVV